MTRPDPNSPAHDAAIDPDALRRAEDVIEQLRWTYIRDWAPTAMEELEAASRNLCHAAETGDAETAAESRAIILRVTHDMKGQAGTFGLDLLQDFAASLHHFAEPDSEAAIRQAELCQAHVSAMRTALADVSTQPEGLVSDTLERELRDGLRKLARLRFN